MRLTRAGAAPGTEAGTAGRETGTDAHLGRQLAGERQATTGN